MKLPKKGKHKIYCSKCGKEYGAITHFGGKRKIKDCEWCKDSFSECSKCYLNETND